MYFLLDGQRQCVMELMKTLITIQIIMIYAIDQNYLTSG